MPQRRKASWWLIALVGVSGCADNSMVLKGQVDNYQKQQLAMSRQYQELQTRAAALDRDQQQLQSLLAQTQQQNKVMEDQLVGMRDQLRAVTTQLAQAKAEKTTSDKKIEAMNASLRRHGETTIAPNNSFAQTLPNLNLPAGAVRRDGDVIRVSVATGQLFEPGTARLRPPAVGTITQVGNELLRLYPDQMIGIEGYTDTDPVVGSQWRSNHEMAIAQAMTVYDTIITRTRLQPNQLFVTGHGPNHPIASNATPDGKQLNRRVEFVVYPEKKQ